jgi:hypothetical protein
VVAGQSGRHAVHEVAYDAMDKLHLLRRVAVVLPVRSVVTNVKPGRDRLLVTLAIRLYSRQLGIQTAGFDRDPSAFSTATDRLTASARKFWARPHRREGLAARTAVSVEPRPICGRRRGRSRGTPVGTPRWRNHPVSAGFMLPARVRHESDGASRWREGSGNPGQRPRRCSTATSLPGNGDTTSGGPVRSARTHLARWRDAGGGGGRRQRDLGADTG